jgi:ribonuclease Y
MTNPYVLSAVAGLIGLAIGCAAVALLLKNQSQQAQSALEDAQKRTSELDANLSARAKELEIESRERVQEEIAKVRETFEKETTDRRRELKENERRQRDRESQIDRRGRSVENKEKQLGAREAEVERRFAEAEALSQRQRDELERVAHLSPEQARELLLARVAEEMREEMNHVARRIEEEAKENAEAKARKIITFAIQRCAVDQTAESAVSVVPLPSDELKGRIIGREGRNIRTFEQLAGVDLIIDDTPEAVVVSCFEPVRREIARVALSNLVQDGRIHPGRIEEVLERARTEVQQKMREAAEAATAEAHVRLPKGLLEVFGRLLYRTSYGQNILRHSVEVSTLAAGIAAEIGANVNVAKRAALLHDIGKALDHEHEGTHIDLGSEVLRRFREQEAVIQAAEEHHLDPSAMSSIEAVIVQIADAISSARPGARRENVEIYIKRLENLEKIANSFNGVEKSFAIQAGRELRIVVKPEQVDDVTALKMSREVAQRIQDEMTYPGEIKVTVIRETRSVEIAR